MYDNVGFIEAVIRRPYIYTIKGTFEEAVVFINGMVSGIAKSSPGAPLVLEWNEFRQWLSSYLNVDRATVFHEMSNNREDALGDLLGFYLEFSAQNGE